MCGKRSCCLYVLFPKLKFRTLANSCIVKEAVLNLRLDYPCGGPGLIPELSLWGVMERLHYRRLFSENFLCLLLIPNPIPPILHTYLSPGAGVICPHEARV